MADRVTEMFKMFYQQGKDEEREALDRAIDEEKNRIDRKDLERQQKRDKNLSDDLKWKMEEAAKDREIAKQLQIQETFRQKQALQQAQQKALMEFNEKIRDQKANAGLTMMKLVESRRAALSPGASDAEETTMMEQDAIRLMMEAGGASQVETRRTLSMIAPYKAPDERATIGQQIQGLIQLVNVAPEAAGGALGKLLDVRLPPGTITKPVSSFQEKMLLEAHEAKREGQFESAEDYTKTITAILEGKSDPYADTDMLTGTEAGPMPSGFMESIIDMRLLDRNFESKELAIMIASRINHHAKTEEEKVKVVEETSRVMKTKSWKIVSIDVPEEDVKESKPDSTKSAADKAFD